MTKASKRAKLSARASTVKKVEHDVAGALGGAAAGTAVGMLAGPAGVIAGAVVGGVIGAVATAMVERDRDATEAAAEADDAASIHANAQKPIAHFVSKRGAFSAASMGVSAGNAASSDEGPSSPPED